MGCDLRTMQLASLGCLLFFAALTVDAAPRRIAASNDLVALTSGLPAWCQETVEITVMAPTTAAFSGDRIALQRLLGQIRLALSDECPKATAIRLTGRLADQSTVYRGSASSGARWLLVDDVPSGTASSPSRSDQSAVGAATPVAPPATLTAIQACDRLGAHPDDPEAFNKGVPDAALSATELIAACRTAIAVSPVPPRLRFQLARGYLAANQYEVAVEQLLLAAEESHGGALAYLGDLALDGAPGIDADPVLARSLYQRALASGYEPAGRVLAEFEDMTEAYERAEAEDRLATPVARKGPLKPYRAVDLLEHIETRSFDSIYWNELWVKSYLINIADNIMSICEAHFTANDIAALKQAANADHRGVAGMIPDISSLSISDGLAFLNGTHPNPMLNGVRRNLAAINEMQSQTEEQASRSDDELFTVSMADTEALFQRHLCKTSGMERFSNNLRAYVANEEAPLPAPRAIFNACTADPPPISYPDARVFCGCFLATMPYAQISQSHRKNLPKSFKLTATSVMNLDYNVKRFRGCR